MDASAGANTLKPANPSAFPLETVFAGERFKGDGQFGD
jgi:hypothetical protein